jgi:hypothetical protein
MQLHPRGTAQCTLEQGRPHSPQAIGHVHNSTNVLAPDRYQVRAPYSPQSVQSASAQ